MGGQIMEKNLENKLRKKVSGAVMAEWKTVWKLRKRYCLIRCLVFLFCVSAGFFVGGLSSNWNEKVVFFGVAGSFVAGIMWDLVLWIMYHDEKIERHKKTVAKLANRAAKDFFFPIIKEALVQYLTKINIKEKEVHMDLIVRVISFIENSDLIAFKYLSKEPEKDFNLCEHWSFCPLEIKAEENVRYFLTGIGVEDQDKQYLYDEAIPIKIRYTYREGQIKSGEQLKISYHEKVIPIIV